VTLENIQEDISDQDCCVGSQREDDSPEKQEIKHVEAF